MALPKKSVKFPARSSVEGLESRQFLSADGFCAHPHSRPAPPAAAVSSAVQGYTPSQIRHAYGFDHVNADGSGQTIAIVDAFKHPSIAADLATFDRQFGIAAPPSLKIVGQTGGSDSTVKVNSGWASEIAMDVEWAHAIAPNAKILLVEAKSDNIPDLLAGVDYARKAAGVSVVSLSWGIREYRGQLPYDSTLTTPLGHPGVTFVASSGDEGSRAGPDWPATSPGVLSVGGTSLNTTGGNGTYASEVGWNKTTGGVSRYEKSPSYQGVVQSGGFRTSPDVSYNADPNTGFAVYSSVRDAGVVGWSVIGGTSAGAPQWAAQVAVADQLRAAAGKGSLDGVSATLPALYSLYSAPNTPGYSAYATDFHDVTQGRSTGRQHPGAGYDEVTGLGSPDAPQVIYALTHADGLPVSTRPAVAAGKATHATAHHFRALANADASANAHLHLNIAEVGKAILVRAPAFAPFNVNINSSAASLDAGRTILPLGAIGRFSPPFAAFFQSAMVQWNEVASASTVLLQTAQSLGEFAATATGVTDSVSSTSRIDGSAVPMLLDFGRSTAMASFADAMADFAYESSALGTVVASAGTHLRAWTVTFAMVGVDVILIGYWRAGRSSAPDRERRIARSKFSLLPIKSPTHKRVI